MIFNALMESDDRAELILIDGGFCRWHLRRDGQLTIQEIIVTKEKRGQGIGMEMLFQLRLVNAKSIFAKCPEDLPANAWYAANGFKLEGTEETKTGKVVNLWRLT